MTSTYNGFWFKMKQEIQKNARWKITVALGCAVLVLSYMVFSFKNVTSGILVLALLVTGIWLFRKESNMTLVENAVILVFSTAYVFLFISFDLIPFP